MKLVSAVLISLTAAVGRTHAMIRDPTPEIWTANLPQGICSVDGNYLLPDVSDNTSYYTCCGQQVTTVRKTCRYFVYGEGQFENLKAAPFDQKLGICSRKRTRNNPNSFKPRAASNASQIAKAALQRYHRAPRLANKEAQATCASAAAAASASREVPRQHGSIAEIMAAGNASVMAPEVGGVWKFIANNEGISSTGVVAINAVLLPGSDKVLLWARLHADGSDNYEPGVVSPDGVPEVSSVYDTNSGTYVVKRIRTTPFCTGQAILSDGQILVAGGDGTKVAGYKNGLWGLRLFNTTGDWDEGQWTTLDMGLLAPRWYPTQVLLPDGYRVVIVGGRSEQAGLGPIRTAEVYDHRRKATFGETPLRILSKEFAPATTLLTTYPVVYVLPYKPADGGDVSMFMFNCDKGSVETIKPGYSWDKEYTDIHNWPSKGFCGATANGGTATMLMLDPKDDYTAEVAMFGGYARGYRQCSCNTPTSDWSHRIRLSKEAVESKSFEWSHEKMPYGRNLNDAVLTPDGKVYIFNGAKNGLITNLRDAALDAWMYDPKASEGSRFTTMSAGRIYRFYHSVALLLPDASVLTMGSEYGECTEACADKTPLLFQHKAERFLPPYCFSNGRPEILSVSATRLKYGTEITVKYLGEVTGAVIMTPAAVSHQVNANQRGVILKVAGRDSAAQSITLKMPPNNYITQPGYHMLFLMNGDVPCKNARWIILEN